MNFSFIIDAIWRTDLDFMVVHHDRLVVLSFMTAASPSNSTTPTTLPVGSTSVVESSTVTALLNSTKGPPTALPFSLVKVLKDFFNMDTSDNNVGKLKNVFCILDTVPL